LVTDHSSSGVGEHEDRQSASKAEFAERLRLAMERKGWTVADTARQVSRLLGEQDKFGSSHLSHYLSGRAVPRARYLQALSRALDVRPEDLLPGRMPQGDDASHRAGLETPLSGRADPARPTHQVDLVHVRDYGDGTALLQVFQRVPWPTALEIMALVKGDTKHDD
jgi:transcriptional regulator with XRE-family HTH domain